MRPLRLYIKDFLCYEHAFIDFTEFSSALVVGKNQNNDMVSNGVGKTTIFKAMEYVLFNYADCPMERIIRDDTSSCEVVFDFMVGDKEYRLARSRTKKGSSDLTLLERNATDGTSNEVLHDDNEQPYLSKKQIQKFWVDKSGSRATDTEKDLAKLIKLTHKAFCSTALFPQMDMNGLSTSTPEKRKGILKDALDLLIYAKLEKIAKDRAAVIARDIEKHNLLAESLGNPTQDVIDFSTQLSNIEKVLTSKTLELTKLTEEQSTQSTKVNELITLHSTLESKFASLLTQDKTLSAEKSRLEISVKEYTSKRSNVAKAAKELIDEIKALKEEQPKLAAEDFSQIDILTEKVTTAKESIAQHNLIIKTSMEKYEELKIPLPSGSKCNHCRKAMTDQDRENHKEHIAKDMLDLQAKIKESKEAIATLNKEVTQHQVAINSLNLTKQKLEGINTKITASNKEYQDKKEIHAEYSALLEKFQNELKVKTAELEAVQLDLKNSSIEEANAIKAQITLEKDILNGVLNKISALNKELTHFNGQKAVLQHSIAQKKADITKKEDLIKLIKDAEEKLVIYPIVIQGFSSTGIPNLIIQNVLDDLQIEANDLLSQIKPGLQLSFSIEKTVAKTGEQADTLDINYTVNGKERYYSVLSGAMKLAVAFSLKLGLSFLLQKTIGTDIKFLLLDEIDPALDKASVDAFADIVKFFQNKFTILVITHNDRLKDKFSHAILVDQDINMVSRARVVSSW